MYLSRFITSNIFIFLTNLPRSEITFGVKLIDDGWIWGFTIYLGVINFGIHKTGA